MQHIELFFECTITIAGTGKADTCIIDITVVQSTLPIRFGQFFITRIQCRLINSPVVIGIFQRGRSCRTALVQGDIAQLHIIGYSFVIRYGRSTDHRRQRLVSIRKDSFGYRIGQHRYGMVTAHTPVLISHQTPDRQHAVYTLLLMLDHRFYHIRIAFRFHQIEERMFRTVCIPKRENRIVSKSFGLMDIVIQTTIRTVHIHIYGRINHGMIKRSIEHCLLVGGTFYFEMI